MGIKYFQPKYNKIYKGNYPSTNIKSLQKYYHYDFAGLVTVVDTENIGLNLFSDSAAAMYYHIAKFDLPNEAERRSFFDLPK